MESQLLNIKSHHAISKKHNPNQILCCILTDLLYLPTHRLQGDGYINNNSFAFTEYIFGNKKC